MRVKYLIDQLKEYDPEDHIIVAYWDRDHVAMNLNRDINDGQWLNIVSATTKTIDNLDWWDDISSVAIETLDKVANDDNA